MIAEIIEVIPHTGGIQIPITETIRQKDESQIVIIDKTHRAIGMTEIVLLTKDDRMIETTLHTGGIQVITATDPHTGGTTTVIIMVAPTIVIAKIDGTIVILVMNRTDDITHRMTNEVHPRTVGTITTIIIVHNEVKVRIRT